MALEEVNFPSNIRKIRLKKGMKMTELARRAGLSLSAVSKIEKGVRRLNQDQLLKICEILECKLSDIFIKESDDVAQEWREEIKRRMADNENSGLKIFGSGLRKIRQNAKKTIAQAGKDANMTLSVYHKIEVGQREVYKNEMEPLAKSFNFTLEQFLDEIAKLYHSGVLDKQIKKSKESVKSVLVPENPNSGIDLSGSLYGAKLYNSTRNKLAPVFGTPSSNGISFKKSDKKMILVPESLAGQKNVYAVVPNTMRLSNILPKKTYVFADASIKPEVGDMAVAIDADFKTLGTDAVKAQIVMVKEHNGKVYGKISAPDENINYKTLHKVIMIVME